MAAIVVANAWIPNHLYLGCLFVFVISDGLETEFPDYP